MFKWILCAPRPLRIDELREAVALDLADSHFDEEKLPSGDIWRLIQMCGNLAILNWDDNTVRLAHHTVQHFLLTQNDFLSADTSISVHLTLPDLELEIGQLCVAYLCLSDFETQLSKREIVIVAAGTDVLQSFLYSQFPVTSVFGKFASTVVSAGGWTESQVGRRPVIVDLSTYKPEQHLYRSMRDKYLLLDYVQHNWAKHATALTCLASSWNKLQEIIFGRNFMFGMKLWDIEMYKPIATVSHLPYLPTFRWAIDEGLIMYIKLLENPPSGSTVWEYYLYEGISGIDPLLRAAKSGHVEVFSYFLSLLKSNVHFPEENCEVVLEMARHASPAILEQIRLWIGKSKSKDCVEMFVETILECLQGWNSQEAVALIHLGVNINIRVKDTSQKPKSPLEVATENYQTEIVSLLQGHNPDPLSRLRSLEFAVDNKMNSLLSLLYPGHDHAILAETFFQSINFSTADICQRLIDLGADINSHPPGRDPPLFIAIKNHSAAKVEMLLNDNRLDICAS